MKLSRGEKIFKFVNAAFLIFLSLLIIYPIVYVISASFSSADAVVRGKVVLLPVDFETSAYSFVFHNRQIWISYANSIYYTVVGTILSLGLTISGAYPLSKPRLRGRAFLTFLLALTLWFTAGMIPKFLNFRDLGLLDKRIAILLQGACSTFNFILLKNFFQSVPRDLEDAANIDGASDLQILTKLYIPLSTPALAAIGLFYAVARWNEYLWPMILVKEDKYMPLQVILKKMVVDLDVAISKDIDLPYEFSKETFVYATIVIAAVPMLILYPFIQKYFVKGIMVGSIKG